MGYTLAAPVGGGDFIDVNGVVAGLRRLVAVAYADLYLCRGLLPADLGRSDKYAPLSDMKPGRLDQADVSVNTRSGIPS